MRQTQKSHLLKNNNTESRSFQWNFSQRYRVLRDILSVRQIDSGLSFWSTCIRFALRTFGSFGLIGLRSPTFPITGSGRVWIAPSAVLTNWQFNLQFVNYRALFVRGEKSFDEVLLHLFPQPTIQCAPGDSERPANDFRFEFLICVHPLRPENSWVV